MLCKNSWSNNEHNLKNAGMLVEAAMTTIGSAAPLPPFSSPPSHQWCPSKFSAQWCRRWCQKGWIGAAICFALRVSLFSFMSEVHSMVVFYALISWRIVISKRNQIHNNQPYVLVLLWWRKYGRILLHCFEQWRQRGAHGWRSSEACIGHQGLKLIRRGSRTFVK